MATAGKVEGVATELATDLATSMTTKFVNVDDTEGYASCNGSFASGVRYNVLEVDELSAVVVELSEGDVTVQVTRPAVDADATLALKASGAFSAAR